MLRVAKGKERVAFESEGVIRTRGIIFEVPEGKSMHFVAEAAEFVANKVRHQGYRRISVLPRGCTNFC